MVCEPASPRNSYGLYDAPVRSGGKPTISLTKVELDGLLNDGGAFLLEKGEAVAMGFLNQYDEQDSVCIEPYRPGVKGDEERVHGEEVE